MQTRRRLAPPTLTLLLAFSLVAAAARSEDGADGALRRHVELLASPGLEGRLTGTEGERRAADYLVEQLRAMGALPLPGRADYRVPFDFTAGSRDVGSSITATERTWNTSDHVQALSFSENGKIAGQVFFAGYGLSVPEGGGEPESGYDSYATLDVTGKIVLVLRYFPEAADQETRSALARYSALRYKAMLARERGALGLLVVTGPNSPNPGKTVPLSFDTAVASSGIVAASISGEVASALFAAAGQTLLAAQTALDGASPHVSGFELGRVELDVALERERRTGNNVAAVLPGSGASSDFADDVAEPWLVLGAHYDHLGRGGDGNSLAREGEVGQVHHGADDNASGVAAVLEAGRRLAGQSHRRRIALAFWSGEELGILGSTAFLKEPVLPASQIAGYLNFDMVGRERGNVLTVQATGSSPDWSALLERANVPVGFDLKLQADPYLPTDSTAFNSAEVPTLNFFTGAHENYHRPTDTADTLSYEGLERVTQLAVLVAGRLADQGEPPRFAKVERRLEGSAGRDALRAYTGTIPDYSSEVEGLLLSGVMEGGPAAAAGLRGGDLIVQFGSQAIKNIYDYTYALDAVKIGEPVKVIFVRDGERHETTLLPRARE